MAETARYKKEYIEVEVHFAADGTMLPRIIEWVDGHKYEIDRVLKIQPAPAMKAGGLDRSVEFQPSVDFFTDQNQGTAI